MLPTQKTHKQTDFAKSNVLIYGAPKVGKTSFAAQFPHALFLATEAGHNFVSVHKVDIAKWEDVYELGKALKSEKHEFKTLVIDIADYFYKHCELYVMKKQGVTHPSDLEFGKGYSMVKDEFIRVVNALNYAGFGLTFISHAKEKTMSTKSEKWTVQGSSMGASAEAVICGLCDFILYFYVGSEGKRMIRTKPTKHLLAGDRSGKLPEMIDLNYETFIKTLEGEKK